MAIQTAKGYHHYELGLYLRDLFGIELIDYWLVCVLAITVHSVVNQKYLGHFLMVVYFLVLAFVEPLRVRAQPVQVRRRRPATSIRT